MWIIYLGLPHIDKQKSSEIPQHEIGKPAHTSQILTTAQFVRQFVSAWTAILPTTTF